MTRAWFACTLAWAVGMGSLPAAAGSAAGLPGDSVSMHPAGPTVPGSSNMADWRGRTGSPFLALRPEAAAPGSGSIQHGLYTGLITHPTVFAPTTREIRATRFQAGFLGADRGATAGLALGFLGMETGLWKERTAWALMGAGAALGAIWGSSLGSEQVGFGIRVESDSPDDR